MSRARYVVAFFSICFFAFLVSRGFRHLAPGFLRGVPNILVTVFATGFVLVWYLRHQAQVARDVLAALRSGNLKARFPLSRVDEWTGLALEFNHMAEDIEILVDKLKLSEQTRARLLQDLAHDIRTPMTSVRMLVETLHDRAHNQTADQVEKKTGIVMGELDYLQRMLDGMLVLAQLEAPDYRRQNETIGFAELVRNEITALEGSPDREGLSWNVEDRSRGACVSGDRFLLQRAIRNALENAASYAKTSVRVELSEAGELVITDDGPGFSVDSLATFGTRRKLRVVDPASSSRASLGIGSAVLRAVVESHGGSVTPGNAPGGGQLRIRLPITATSSRRGIA